MFIKDIDTVLKIWFAPPNYDSSSLVIEITVFSVVNSYALLDCYVEKFIPFIFDALAFQRNMNCLSYEVSKALPCGRLIVHKNKMLYHKPGNFFPLFIFSSYFWGNP